MSKYIDQSVALCPFFGYFFDMSYPIRVVARETGLSTHVIRVWEKRYRAVTPQRTTTRRRCYSDDEVRRLALLRQVTSLGHPIGSVAHLQNEALHALLKTAAAGESVQNALSNVVSTSDSSIIRECIEAVKAFDADRLKIALEGAVVASGQRAVLRRVIAPLAQQLGDLWSAGILRISHEHFATAVIRNLLLDPPRQYAGANAALILVAATPQGQLHELGSLMAAALAAEQGWRFVYLGPSLPAAEIAAVALHNGARVVLLSLIYPDCDPNIDRELQDLRRFLPKHVVILIGGRAANSYRSAIETIGAILVYDLDQLQVELAKISATRL